MVRLMPDRDTLVRLDVAAKELDLDARTVQKYCRCGYLRCKKLPGGHWRVYRSSLDAAISEAGPSTTRL